METPQTNRLMCTSHAKINWWLRVGPPRPDGYHELETVFQELEIGETIGFHKNDLNEIRLQGFPPDISLETNLVTKSYKLMREEFSSKVGGLDVSITKTLPRGGGLGGGSSNAACTIVAINQLFNLGASDNRLQELSGKIGADVAFFIKGGTAIGRGRGELIEQLSPSPKYWIVLVMPGESMSTAAAYQMLDSMRQNGASVGELQHKLSPFLTGLYSGEPAVLAQQITNDFEQVAEDFAWFRLTRDKLLDAGAIRAFLCGSGSTVAGIVADEFSGQRIAEKVGGILTSTRYTP